MKILRDAVLIAALAAVAGLMFNGTRAQGIALVRTEPFAILVPCPAQVGEVESLAAADPAVTDPDTVLVDARGADAFEDWHAEGAILVPMDFLEPTPEATIQSLIASGAARIVVYGDGRDPDSGRELARELAGRGVRNVSFVTGGAEALRATREGGAE